MVKGIDISEFQGDVDFNALKTQIDFVFIRSSFGVGYVDAKFERNRDGARKANLIRGFYHYSYPQYNYPEQEAKYFMSVVKGLEKDELLVLDFEEKWNGDRANWCLRFLETIRKELGFKPLIYLNLDFINSSNWSEVIRNDYGLWLAFWDGKESGAPVTPWPFVAFKQYSSTGRITGIHGAVDLNVFFGEKNLIKEYGYKPPIITIPPITEPVVEVKPPKIKLDPPNPHTTDKPAFSAESSDTISFLKTLRDLVSIIVKIFRG